MLKSTIGRKSGFFPAHLIPIERILQIMENISTGLDQFSATYNKLILIWTLIFLKIRYTRGNQSSFMTKELYKETMKRSNLHKKFLLWKMRREYFANIKINNIADNKKKPFSLIQ